MSDQAKRQARDQRGRILRDHDDIVRGVGKPRQIHTMYVEDGNQLYDQIIKTLRSVWQETVTSARKRREFSRKVPKPVLEGTDYDAYLEAVNGCLASWTRNPGHFVASLLHSYREDDRKLFDRGFRAYYRELGQDPPSIDMDDSEDDDKPAEDKSGGKEPDNKESGGEAREDESPSAKQLNDEEGSGEKLDNEERSNSEARNLATGNDDNDVSSAARHGGDPDSDSLFVRQPSIEEVMAGLRERANLHRNPDSSPRSIPALTGSPAKHPDDNADRPAAIAPQDMAKGETNLSQTGGAQEKENISSEPQHEGVAVPQTTTRLRPSKTAGVVDLTGLPSSSDNESDPTSSDSDPSDDESDPASSDLDASNPKSRNRKRPLSPTAAQQAEAKRARNESWLQVSQICACWGQVNDNCLVVNDADLVLHAPDFVLPYLTGGAPPPETLAIPPAVLENWRNAAILVPGGVCHDDKTQYYPFSHVMSTLKHKRVPLESSFGKKTDIISLLESGGDMAPLDICRLAGAIAKLQQDNKSIAEHGYWEMADKLPSLDLVYPD